MGDLGEEEGEIMTWPNVVVILIMALFSGFCVWRLSKAEPIELPKPNPPTWIVKKNRKTEKKGTQ